jgi:hypothetical protein
MRYIIAVVCKVSSRRGLSGVSGDSAVVLTLLVRDGPIALVPEFTSVLQDVVRRPQLRLRWRERLSCEQAPQSAIS